MGKTKKMHVICNRNSFNDILAHTLSYLSEGFTVSGDFYHENLSKAKTIVPTERKKIHLKELPKIIDFQEVRRRKNLVFSAASDLCL